VAEDVADRIEIDDLLTRYATAVDTKDWELYQTVFTADAVIDYTSSGGIRGGLAEVTKWLAESLAMFSMSQHLVTNRDVRVTGDTATSHSYLYNAMGRTKRDGTLDLMFVGGGYRDKLRRTNDGWRIIERVQDTAWLSSSPGAAGPPRRS
jgi:3-phenylpropionate/cinnamic acid dioxygenase small subunit